MRTFFCEATFPPFTCERLLRARASGSQAPPPVCCVPAPWRDGGCNWPKCVTINCVWPQYGCMARPGAEWRSLRVLPFYARRQPAAILSAHLCPGTPCAMGPIILTLIVNRGVPTVLTRARAA